MCLQVAAQACLRRLKASTCFSSCSAPSSWWCWWWQAFCTTVTTGGRSWFAATAAAVSLLLTPTTTTTTTTVMMTMTTPTLLKPTYRHHSRLPEAPEAVGPRGRNTVQPWTCHCCASAHSCHQTATWSHRRAGRCEETVDWELWHFTVSKLIKISFLVFLNSVWFTGTDVHCQLKSVQ